MNDNCQTENNLMGSNKWNTEDRRKGEQEKRKTGERENRRE